MRLFNKKILATLAAAVTAVSVGSVFSTSASAATFLQGDANGDGMISMLDVMCVNYYLTGKGNADGLMLARMDCDNDYVITISDYNLIAKATANVVTLPTVTRDALTSPLNEDKMYVAYYPNDKQEYRYTLYAVEGLPNMSSRSTIQTPDETNANIIRITNSFGLSGTGFIVDNHVIATAAHMVMDDWRRDFYEEVNISLYNDAGTQIIDTLTAIEYHVPITYKTALGSDIRKYDYALIYVEEDLSDYGVWSLGVATDEFMNTNASVSVSGFDYVEPYGYGRYLSTGTIMNCNSVYELQFNATSQNSKRGAPVYYTTSENTSSVIAINACLEQDMLNSEIYSYGVRMTPSIIQFYLQNENICR